MKSTSKQSAGSDINVRNNPFFRVRLKWTVYYTVGVLLLLLAFSGIVYTLFSKNITDNIESDATGDESRVAIENQIIAKAQSSLQTTLLFVDGGIMLLTILFSYYLAGKTLHPLEKIYLKQKRFIGDAAHELRTPLAVMKTGMESVIQDPSHKNDLIKMMKDALEEVDYMSHMVDDLLFLARSDDTQQVFFSPIPIGELAQKQIEFLLPYAKNKGISLAIEPSPAPHIMMRGHMESLKRMIRNILKNAIDYNVPQGSVLLSIRETQHHLTLIVADTGMGIPPEEISHVFERFYKVSAAHERTSGGAGLGLSIVHNIVHMHKGKIEIQSQPHKGTVVTVFFPKITSS